jgi:hypothetical protein
MSSVHTPKPVMDMIVVRLLPIASAKWPKIIAPSGRPTNVAAKIEPLTSVVAGAERSDDTKYMVAGASTTIGK